MGASSRKRANKLILSVTTLQKIMVATTFAILAGVGIYEAQEITRLRNSLQSLQDREAPLAEQNRLLQRERDAATNRLALMAASSPNPKGNSAELLKLRGEVTHLRNETNLLHAGATNSPEFEDLKSFAARVSAVKQRLEEMPERKIPELQFLHDEDWFKNIGETDPLETDDDFRREFAHLRDAAKDAFAQVAMNAMGAYAAANGNQLPNDPLQLKPFFDPPLSDADAILSRYKMLYTGNVNDLPQQQIPVMGERTPADPMIDSYYSIGIGTYSKTDVSGYSQSHP